MPKILWNTIFKFYFFVRMKQNKWMEKLLEIKHNEEFAILSSFQRGWFWALWL